MTVPEASVAVELAQLRGEINTGLEQIKGTLGILVERTNRTDADVKQLRTDTEKTLTELRADVEALKTRRWPLQTVSVLAGAAGTVTGVLALILR
ncbi:hypothetical protein AB0I98_16675 [Streptomyces sp. NPDC050211]|uniref:hypothetical protein n=1 Tax=Streptomyces sp. NPDC050211 TaxID=3154932 RepID=UPI003441D99F